MNLPNDKTPGRMIFRPLVRRMDEEKRMNLPNDFCCEMMRLMVVEEGDVLYSKNKDMFFTITTLKKNKVERIPLYFCPWCGASINGKEVVQV